MAHLSRIIILFTFIFIAEGTYAQGSTYYWQGSSGNVGHDWSDPVNWYDINLNPATSSPGMHDDVIFENITDTISANGLYSKKIEFKSLTVQSTASIVFDLDSIVAFGDISLSATSKINVSDLHIASDCNLSIDGANNCSMTIIIDNGAVVTLADDLLQESCVLGIWDGIFNTSPPLGGGGGGPYEVDLDQIVVWDSGSQYTKGIDFSSSNIILRRTGQPLEGLKFLDSSVSSFEHSTIKFKPPSSWPNDTAKYMVYFDLATYEIGTLTLERPTTLTSGGDLNGLYLLPGESYYFTDELDIQGPFEYLSSVNPSCGSFTKIAGSQAYMMAEIDLDLNGSSAFTFDYVMLNNIKSTGDPITIQNFIIDTLTRSQGQNFYHQNEYLGETKIWTGAVNNGWFNVNNWKDSLTNAGSVCIPTAADNVIFDFYSFDSLGQRVNIPPGKIAMCNNFIWQQINYYPELHINGELNIYGNMELDSNMSIISGEVAASVNLFADNKAHYIHSRGQTIPTDVELLGYSDSSFTIHDKLEVKELRVSHGGLVANKKKIIADQLIVEDGALLDLDSCVVIIEDGAHIYEQNSAKFFDEASFDVKGEVTGSLATCKLIFKADTAVFNLGKRNNGAAARYDVVDFRGNGHLLNFDEKSGINNLLLRNQKEYTIGVDDSIDVGNILILDTPQVNNGLTSIKALNMYRSGTSIQTLPSNTAILRPMEDICLEDILINDIFLDNSTATASCNTSNVSFTDYSLNINKGNWQHSPGCYSYLTGYALDMRDSSRIYPGKASCFRVIPNNANQVMFDTIEINYLDTNGNFLFSNLDTGSYYIIKIDPADTSLVPYYYPDRKLWSQASQVHVLSDTGGLVVELSPLTQPAQTATSNKVITGQLNPSTTGSTPQPLFNMSNAYYRGPVDIEDSLVIGLFNLDPNVDDVVQSVYSNQAGFFKFVNVDVGSYRIHPDIAGIPVKDTLTINIYATSDSADVTFEVADSMIYPAASVIVTTDVRSDIELLLWPNPVVEGVNIRAPFIIEKLELFDIMSRKIKTVFTDANEVHLGMQGLPSGIYIMYVNGERVRERISKL